MIDADDQVVFLTEARWRAVRGLALQLADPSMVYERVFDLVLAAVRHNTGPGVDMELILCEVLGRVRDELFAAL